MSRVQPRHKAMDAARVLSLRDPQGQVVKIEKRLFRCVHPHVVAEVQGVLQAVSKLGVLANGRIVAHRELVLTEKTEVLRRLREFDLCDDGESDLLLEHPEIELATFPYEWCSEALFDAGQFTLELAERLNELGLELKDATPFNILFEGTRPVFTDILSFQKITKTTWSPCAQFLQSFIYPLLLQKHFGLNSRSCFLENRDGLPGSDLRRMCSLWKLLSRDFFPVLTLPHFLSRFSGLERQLQTQAQAQALPAPDLGVRRKVFRSLQGSLERAHGKSIPASHWSGYYQADDSAEEGYLQTKTKIVHEFLDLSKPSKVLDIGCNTGVFSLEAARLGASVWAIDRDEGCISVLWKHARRESLKILPLVVNIARPSPALGWRDREHESFLERVKGRPDCVLMLALLHHLFANEAIPFPEVVNLLAELTSRDVILEYVAPCDDKFSEISRGRDFSSFTSERFESVAARQFDIVRKSGLKAGQRILYLLRKRR